MKNRRRRLRDARKLTGEDQRGTVEKLSRRDARILLGGRPKAQKHPWEVRRPVCTGGAGPQGILELAVTPLHHAVGLRVVGGGEMV